MTTPQGGPTKHTSRLRLLAPVLALIGLASLAPSPAEAGDPVYVRTGQAVQTANHWPFTVEVLAVVHEVERLPPTRSSQAMIALDADKRLTLTALRDLDMDRLAFLLRAGYRRNGCDDVARVEALLQGLSGKRLERGGVVTIRYDAVAKTTALGVRGGGSATVEGVDFMRATWSIWFGRTDPSDLGAKLTAGT